MKQLILVLLISFSFISTAQKKNIVVYKNDGTQLSVKKYTSKPKYLKLFLENNRTVDLPYDQLGRIEYDFTFRKKTEKVVKEFVNISNRNGFLMNRRIVGKCNFYQVTGGAYGGGSITSYYVKRDGEQIATHLGSNGFVDVGNYKKRALKYFEDCPEAIARIKKKYKRKKVKDLVEFYNKTCD